MAGMNFQYDETGSTFYYFLVSFYALALIPFSIWVFRAKEDKGMFLFFLNLSQQKVVIKI